MMMYEICAVLACDRAFGSFSCCGVSVSVGDGCTE